MIDKILLCGHNITVQNMEHVGESTIANSDYAKAIISMEAGLPCDVYYCTLIHEVIHLLMNMDGMRDAHNERDVCALANGIFQFIKDNPTVMNNILSARGTE
ncbi:MAG: hypothetical protein NTV22_00755 [bacterium]|nr:hypothetical protein [bacterium]